VHQLAIKDSDSIKMHGATVKIVKNTVYIIIPIVNLWDPVECILVYLQYILF